MFVVDTHDNVLWRPSPSEPESSGDSAGDELEARALIRSLSSSKLMDVNRPIEQRLTIINLSARLEGVSAVASPASLPALVVDSTLPIIADDEVVREKRPRAKSPKNRRRRKSSMSGSNNNDNSSPDAAVPIEEAPMAKLKAESAEPLPLDGGATEAVRLKQHRQRLSSMLQSAPVPILIHSPPRLVTPAETRPIHRSPLHNADDSDPLTVDDDDTIYQPSSSSDESTSAASTVTLKDPDSVAWCSHSAPSRTRSRSRSVSSTATSTSRHKGRRRGLSDVEKSVMDEAIDALHTQCSAEESLRIVKALASTIARPGSCEPRSESRERVPDRRRGRSMTVDGRRSRPVFDESGEIRPVSTITKTKEQAVRPSPKWVTVVDAAAAAAVSTPPPASSVRRVRATSAKGEEPPLRRSQSLTRDYTLESDNDDLRSFSWSHRKKPSHFAPANTSVTAGTPPSLESVPRLRRSQSLNRFHGPSFVESPRHIMNVDDGDNSQEKGERKVGWFTALKLKMFRRKNRQGNANI